MQRWAVPCVACKGPAFVVTGDLPSPTDVVAASRCQHINGEPLRAADDLRCDSCGADFSRTGVLPSTEWRLMADLVAYPHNEHDMPFGTHADRRDIASVRLAIASATRPPTRQRRRRASPKPMEG